MTSRKLLAWILCLFTLFAWPAAAQDTPHIPVVLSGAGQPFTAKAPTPQPSAFFTYANSFVGGTSNSGLILPPGAMFLPCSTVVGSCAANANALGSYTFVMHFKRDDNIATLPVNPTTQWLTLAGTCLVASCAGGNDHTFSISSPYLSATQAFNSEIQLQARVGGVAGSTFWNPPATVSQSTVAPCVASLKCHTGVLPQPNQNYCAVLTQYGADSPATTSWANFPNSTGAASTGLMALSVLDINGNIITNGQVITTSANNTVNGNNFYYTASAPRTQAAIGDMFHYIGTAQGPGTLTGSIATNILTVTSVTGSLTQIALANVLSGAGVTVGTTITKTSTGSTNECGGIPCTGAGGTGTYALSASMTVVSESMVNTPGFTQGAAGAIGPVAMLWGVFPNSAATPDIAALRSICGGNTDIKAGIALTGLSIQSLYRLNDAGTWAGDASGAIHTNATVIGVVSNASPLIPPPCLLPTDPGPGYVFRVEPGQWGGGATGTVWASGTYNNASCGGRISGLQMQVLDNTNTPVSPGWKTVATKVNGGSFRVSYPGVPAGYGYSYQLRPKNSPSYVYTVQGPFGVGLAIGWLGQSQMCVPGTLGAGEALTVGSQNLAMINMPLTASGNYPTQNPNSVSSALPGVGHAGVMRITPISTPDGGAANQAVGDGILRMLMDTADASTWPVMWVSYCKSGQAIDAWTYGYTTGVPATQTITGSGTGPYAGTLAISQFIANANFIPGFFQTLQHGSLKILANGMQVAHDDSAGGLVADAGSGATGTINYLTGAVSASFSGTPAAPVTTTWTSLQDTAIASYGQITPYLGSDVWGGDSNSGFASQIASRVAGPLSMVVYSQCTTNAPEISSSTASGSLFTTGSASLKAKTNYVFLNRFAQFSWWDPNTPILVEGYQRSTESGLGNNAACRQYLWDYAGQTAQFYYGGSATDIFDQCNGSPQPSCAAHPDTTIFGGQRAGRWYAKTIEAVQQQSIGLINGPRISGAVVTDSTHITITYTLAHGTALQTCGTASATLVCTPTGVGATVTGFRFGNSNTVMYDELGVDDGASGATSPGYNILETFSCVIATATTVICTKSNTTLSSWTSGVTYYSYLASSPFFHAYELRGITVTPGSGYTGGGPTLVITGVASPTNCVAAPTITAVRSGGAISATLTTTGTGCPTIPTFSLAGFTGGSGASVVGTSLGTLTQDENDVGNDLYDNSGGFGTSPVYEPGLKAWPLMQPALAN